MLHTDTPTLRPVAPMRRVRRDFSNRSGRVPLIIGAALRHYEGQEKVELLMMAQAILEQEVGL